MYKIKDDNHKHYLAGLLDGECTADMIKNKYPRLRLALVDRDLISHVADILKEEMRVQFLNYPQQALWCISLHGQKAIDVMYQILPLMCSRRSNKIATILGWSRKTKKYNVPTIPYIKNHFYSAIKRRQTEIC